MLVDNTKFGWGHKAAPMLLASSKRENVPVPKHQQLSLPWWDSATHKFVNISAINFNPSPTDVIQTAAAFSSQDDSV